MANLPERLARRADFSTGARGARIALARVPHHRIRRFATSAPSGAAAPDAPLQRIWLSSRIDRPWRSRRADPGQTARRPPSADIRRRTSSIPSRVPSGFPLAATPLTCRGNRERVGIVPFPTFAPVRAMSWDCGVPSTGACPVDHRARPQVTPSPPLARRTLAPAPAIGVRTASWCNSARTRGAGRHLVVGHRQGTALLPLNCHYARRGDQASSRLAWVSVAGITAGAEYRSGNEEWGLAGGPTYRPGPAEWAT